MTPAPSAQEPAVTLSTAPDTADLNPEPEPDPSWTDSAAGTFRTVLAARSDLDGADFSSLWQAASLESAADRLDAVALAAGMLSTGSSGQVVAHPAAVEARLSRSAAAGILARLVSSSPGGSRTDSERGRAAARARWAR